MMLALRRICLAIGIVALTAAALFVPESKSPHPRRFDPLGQLAMVGLLASCVYAIIEAPHAGWLSALTLSLSELRYSRRAWGRS